MPTGIIDQGSLTAPPETVQRHGLFHDMQQAVGMEETKLVSEFL